MKFKVLSTMRINNSDPDFRSKAEKLFSESGVDTSRLFAVAYHNYESDYKGDYDMSILVPSDTGNYCANQPVFKRVNDMSEVLGAWQDIWRAEETTGLDRAYGFDYEVHYPEGTVAICLSMMN